MFRFVFLLLVFALVFPGCSSFSRTDGATATFPHAHDFGATAIAFSPDSRLLVSGGHRGDIRLWDVRKKTAIADLPAHGGVVRAIQFLTDKTFASAAEDGRLILWEGTTVKITKQLSFIAALTLAQGHLVSGEKNGWIRVWDRNLNELASLNLNQQVVSLASHDDRLAVATNRQILVLDDNLSLLKKIQIGWVEPHDLQFSPDGRTLAAGTWFGVNTWNLATGKTKYHATGQFGLVTSISYSPDGRDLASIGRHTDSSVHIEDTQDFKVERSYQSHKLCAYMIRISPDGRWMASTSDDESVRLYDLSHLPASPKAATSN
jgi:WD40 repeat protein